MQNGLNYHILFCLRLILDHIATQGAPRLLSLNILLLARVIDWQWQHIVVPVRYRCSLAGGGSWLLLLLIVFEYLDGSLESKAHLARILFCQRSVHASVQIWFADSLRWGEGAVKLRSLLFQSEKLELLPDCLSFFRVSIEDAVDQVPQSLLVEQLYRLLFVVWVDYKGVFPIDVTEQIVQRLSLDLFVHIGAWPHAVDWYWDQ